MGKRVLVLAETKDGNVRNVSFEALTVAQQLAEGGEVIAALIGSDGASHAAAISRYGPAKLYVAEAAELAVYTADAYMQTVLQLIAATAPELILMGHTAMGKEIAPRVAARLGIGLVSDCTAIAGKEGAVTFERPIYAGKAFQTRRFGSGLAFATLRANNFSLVEQPVETQIISFQPEITTIRTIVKEVVRKTAGGVDLSEAKIIVSGGRGVKSAEGFAVLQELADVLGGAVGASRGACDAGYCNYALQIGQTGKVVTPDLYIACGISGAIQHLAGMSNSKCIVAINKDPDAPIFQVADYGIVGDLFEVVPLLKEEFQKALLTQ